MKEVIKVELNWRVLRRLLNGRHDNPGGRIWLRPSVTSSFGRPCGRCRLLSANQLRGELIKSSELVHCIVMI